MPNVRALNAIAALPVADGLAVGVPGGSARVLPWPVARGLLDDPGLTVATSATVGCSAREIDRLLAAQAAGDAAADAWPPDRDQVRALRRHQRPWARTVDLAVLTGDLPAACCRAGLALPGDDPLRQVAAMAALLASQTGGLAVRQRLLRDHPWIGDAAWMATTGYLAEVVVLHGVRRDQMQRPVAAGAGLVADLLGDPGRFRAAHPEVARVLAAILGGSVAWNERGHLTLRPDGDWRHHAAGLDLIIGVGGLHSIDPPGVLDGPLCDLDVASYYPSIIARDRIAPPQLPDFPERVATLMTRRLAAKRSGDHTASQALKYVINSLYGQLGNSRSGLFSPPEALRVVLTGQVQLLMLIDLLTTAGANVLSANTDGVVVRGETADAATAWQQQTGLVLERTAYGRLWRTSVNDYVACGPDGRVVKAKGRFAGGEDEAAGRHAAAPIIARAAVEHLTGGRALAETVAAATSLSDFTLWRQAHDLSWDARPITGSVVRWIVSRSGRPIVQHAGGRVRSTVAAQALLVDDPATMPMRLLDQSWYVAEAQALVDRVLGTCQGTRQLSFLDDA